VQTCDAARQALAGADFELLIVDLVLPDGSGIELADEAVERRVPCIMMSGNAPMAQQLVQEGRQCLSKPFALPDFLAAVQARLQVRTSYP